MGEGTILSEIGHWLRGDDDAFRVVFYHYQPRVYRYTFKYLHNRSQAEDITMDILVRVWQKRNTITAAGTFENYLFTIARNCLVNEWRKKIDVLLSLENIDHQSADAAADSFIYKELEATYRQCLSDLPEQRRKIFLMHREESLTYNEIAKKLEISPKTVENQIGATLKHLRTSLANYLPVLL